MTAHLLLYCVATVYFVFLLRPIVRYGPKRYSFDHPDASKAIYGHGTQFPKSSWYTAWNTPQPGEWNLFAKTDQRAHALERKAFSSTYSMTSLVSYEPYVDECADLFHRRLSEIAHTILSIDLGYWHQCYAFDVIGLVTYGKRFDFLDQGVDIGGVISVIDSSLVYSTIVGIYAGLHWYVFRLLNWLAGKGGNGFTYVVNFTRERINDYRVVPKAGIRDTQGGAIAESFLAKFCKMNSDDPSSFTPYHIFSRCTANIGAGSDTTAISLSAILYYLLKEPKCLQALQDEIDTAWSQDKMSAHLTFRDAQNMPYLQAVIKEALRVQPATGLPLERVVPKNGATIAGQFFPGGSIVGVNCWVEHRNKHIFGEDAERFRPDRWLINDVDKLAVMNRHWIPFGMGSRTCIGKNIPLLEISKLMPHIIRDFDFELQGGPNKPWQTSTYWFVKPKDFRVKVTLRAEAH